LEALVLRFEAIPLRLEAIVGWPCLYPKNEKIV